ncbi:MAG: hypothetical protein OQK75_10005 [Gammaproteobacteria bacterium]|nr:hypothetical protein [Gammaproteobacteria bacterium]MCW8987985.1 hypothetical protein [Gammaproteobacteria bacterium]
MKLNKYTNYITLSLFFVLAFLLQGCSVGGKFLTEVSSFSAVKNDEVVIVGTIELKPKLDKDEQELDPKGVWDVMGYGAKNKNRGMITFNSKPESSGYKYVINPELGKVFFFKVPRDLNYIVDGEILTVFSRFGSEKILLPTGFKINIKTSDKAVYIGKITYIRDDFNSVTRVEFKDDYNKALKEFRKKFGEKYKLRKSLVKAIK